MPLPENWKALGEPTKWEQITVEAEFPLRDRFAMQYMEQRWEHLRIGMKYLEEEHIMASWCAAYRYADLAMKAREPQEKEVSGD